jgi:thioredoxin-dependent peroxiredoxin
VRDEILRYEASNVRPFGVNPASVEAHAGYAARLGISFPLLSDPGLAISRSYGALRPDGEGISRSVVLVDRGGYIRYSQAGAPGADIVLESLRSS